jgi:hypothetical protein
MRSSGRRVRNVLLCVFLCSFSLPLLCFGGYLIVCWLRIHSSNVYYANYPYATTAVACFAVASLNLWVTLSAVWRRSFYGLLFVIPVIVGLTAMEIAPDHTPYLSSLTADTNHLSGVHSSLGVWYEKNRRFPASESELRDAVGPDSASQYKQRGSPLPYELVVVTNADGPRLTDTSQRPGVIYYCVSKNLQEFWVTMTRLQSDIAATARLESAPGLPEEFWMFHEAGRDYSNRTVGNRFASPEQR